MFVMSLDAASTKKVDRNSGTAWHTLTVEASFERLKTTSDGLTAAEAAGRLESFGPNELEVSGRVSPWAILRRS